MDDGMDNMDFESFDAPDLSGATAFDAGFGLDTVDDLQNVDADLNQTLGHAPSAQSLAAPTSMFYPTDSNVGAHSTAWNTDMDSAPAEPRREESPRSTVTDVIRAAKKRSMQEWLELHYGIPIDQEDDYEKVESNHTHYRKKRARARGVDFIGTAFTTVAHILETGDKHFEHPIEGVNLENLQMTIEDNIASGDIDDILDELYTKWGHLIDNIPVEVRAAYYFSSSVLKVGWTNRAMAELDASSAPDDFKKTIRRDPKLQQIYAEAMQREIDSSQNGAATRINDMVMGGGVPGRGPPPPMHTSVRPDVELARGVGPRAEMQGPTISLNPNGTENLDDLVKKVRSKRKREQ